MKISSFNIEKFYGTGTTGEILTYSFSSISMSTVKDMA